MSVGSKLASIAGVALLALGVRTTRLAAFEAHERGERYEDVYYLPPPAWLSPLSLGYADALADLLWCRLLIYYGEELVNRSGVRNLFHYVDAMLALSPDFQAPYRWVAMGAMYRPIPPNLPDALRALEYLRKAVKRWPQDGEIHWEIGSFIRFELLPLQKDPAAKLKLDEEAAEHLHIAALKGAGPAWLALNNSTLLQKLGKKERAIRQLEEVYATVDDDEARSQIAIRIAQLRSETAATALQSAIEEFEGERRASFPYLSGDLFLLIGPKQDAKRQRGIATLFEPDIHIDEEP